MPSTPWPESSASTIRTCSASGCGVTDEVTATGSSGTSGFETLNRFATRSHDDRHRRHGHRFRRAWPCLFTADFRSRTAGTRRFRAAPRGGPGLFNIRRLSSDAETRPWPPVPNPFEIDIRLLNTGTQVAAINSARLVMQQFASLPECMAQGGFASSGSYSASLPDHASPGRTIDIPVSQLVPAGGADRFDLLLRSQLPGTSWPTCTSTAFISTCPTTRESARPGRDNNRFPVSPRPWSYFWSETVLTNPGPHPELVQLGRAGSRNAISITHAPCIRFSHCPAPARQSSPRSRPSWRTDTRQYGEAFPCYCSAVDGVEAGADHVSYC